MGYGGRVGDNGMVSARSPVQGGDSSEAVTQWLNTRRWQFTSNPNFLSSALPGSLWKSWWPSGRSGLGSKSWALAAVSERVSWPFWFIVCFYLPETLTFFQKSIGFSIGVDQGRKGWLNFLPPFFSRFHLMQPSINLNWILNGCQAAF